MATETGPPSADESESGRDRRLWTVISALPYLVPVGLLLVLAAAVMLVAIGAYTREWEWTGFLDKTLWDWMKLLIVPTILALGGLLITQIDRLNSTRAQQLDKERLAQDREQTQRQLELARRGQITERFSRAIGQLASESLEIRLGGIYSLERIAHEDRDYHWPIVEVLTTYVRRHSARMPETRRRNNAVPLAPDIQAILTIIGRRSFYHMGGAAEYGPINLRDTDLSGADLMDAHLRGADLRGADLRDANLQRADLRDANLENANLEDVNLRRTLLKGATMPDGSKHR